MMAVLTKSLTALRDAFNQAFPDRDKASDGWIGDEDHQDSVSDHNPDDTPGVRAGQSDADTKQEVRAIDVDADLRSTITMRDVIDAILATPADRNRLKYIIFNAVIWSASNDWAPRAYTGSNPHTKHAHYSGDQADDESTAPWSSVLNLGDAMPAGRVGLKLGDGKANNRQEPVKSLQNLLNRAGFDPGAQDGEYGPATSAALLACRQAMGSAATSGDSVNGDAEAQLIAAVAIRYAKEYAGQDGADGEDGKDGTDGKDGRGLAVGDVVTITAIG